MYSVQADKDKDCCSVMSFPAFIIKCTIDISGGVIHSIANRGMISSPSLSSHMSSFEHDVMERICRHCSVQCQALLEQCTHFQTARHRDNLPRRGSIKITSRWHQVGIKLASSWYQGGIKVAIRWRSWESGATKNHKEVTGGKARWKRGWR